MLTHLSIRGFAIIDVLTIDLTSGFNVITGETGSGKSVLIRALNFILGSKVGVESIRKGCAEATVTGQFVVQQNHLAVATAIELGLQHTIEETPGGEAVFILRRTLSDKGRSQAFINDTAVSAGTLRSLGSALIDVFGQHDHHRLLDPKQHIDFIDSFSQNISLRQTLKSQLRLCSEAIGSIRASLESWRRRQRDQDYLQFRFDEWQEFSPSQDDYNRVRAICDQSKGQSGRLEALRQALGCLEGSGSGESVGSNPAQVLREAARIIKRLPTANLNGGVGEILTRTEELAESLEGLTYDFTQLLEGQDFDEAELERCEERLAGYQSLFRKYGTSDMEGLLASGQQLRSDITMLVHFEAELATQLTALRSNAKESLATAHALQDKRRKGAEELAKRVGTELKQLSMPQAGMTTRFEPVETRIQPLELSGLNENIAVLWQECANLLSGVSENGSFTAEFMLSTNRNESSLSLHKMASGGELSRIMLALKTVSASELEPTVLVFDEIDAGISGKVADIMGRKMLGLAEDFQVICISHLPQVAAWAQAHYSVRKLEKKSRTSSVIERLSPEDRAQELAKLLSGEDVTEHSLANARALLQQAHN